ncbi:hypothetical protein M1K005_1288 [Staphylococcus aureus]|nr:hypothetical protein M1K005_1288 [Staphylococcus aureus]GBX26369.1 hypothetical protein M6C036_0709 [Staphylococcus aureus]
MTSKDITQISVIAAILTILAVLKIPSIIPGLDFQLSAPAALLILAFFGIKKYFLGGLLSSLLLLVFGVFNPINVIISIIFRVIAIAVVYLLKINVLSLVLASVLGSLVSRLLIYYFKFTCVGSVVKRDSRRNIHFNCSYSFISHIEKKNGSITKIINQNTVVTITVGDRVLLAIYCFQFLLYLTISLCDFPNQFHMLI